MTELYLVDKSALARVSRVAAVREAFEKLDQQGVLATSPIIELELGYSARDLAEFDTVDAARRELYRELPLSKLVTDRARTVQRALVKQGRHRAPSVPDLLIAATAEIHGAMVVHYDRDFDVIAAHTRQTVRWIVPAGSVD